MPNLRTENAAELAAILAGRLASGKVDHENAARPASVVLEVQKAARILHRNSERRCCEDLGCPSCGGSGNACDEYRNEIKPRRDCGKCAGGGETISRREASLVKRIRASLAPFGLRVYEQGDPRGWPLYLIPEEAGDAKDDHANYNSRGVAVCPH